MKRLQVYPAPGISVTFDPNLCQHSGVCLMTLPDVFDVRRARWIHADAASADRVAHAIDKCPSGALQYYRNVERDPSAAFRLSKAVATNRITLAAIADAPRDERAREIGQAILEGRGYRWVGLYDVLADQIAAVAWTGDEAPANPRFARTVGLNGDAVAQGKTVVANDVATDARYLATLAATRAEMIVPVLGASGAVVGTIDVASERAGAFDGRDVEWVEACARAARHLWER
jgi:putative methionine-R-sulfoxide reductase with GAF domain